jgi:hypothetical protein
MTGPLTARLQRGKRYWIPIVAFTLGLSIGIDIHGVPWAAGRAYQWVRSAFEPPAATGPNATGDDILVPNRGLWNLVRTPNKSTLDPAAVQKLKSIGYLGGYSPAKPFENITAYEPESSFNGLNLYTSGHAPEALLIDMNGKVLHRWQYDYEKALPGHLLAPTPSGAEHWRYAHVMANGDLLAIYEGQGLIRLDRDSRLLWALPIGAHHRLTVAENGDIYVLTREVKQIPAIHPTEPVLEDFITVVSPAGVPKRNISLLSAFADSSYRPLLDRMPAFGDLFHTNALQILDGTLSERSPAFAAGNILVSLPLLDTIAIVDPARESVVWSLSGQWKFQHTPRLLPNGHVLLFDNRGLYQRSSVLEIDPFTQQKKWTFEGSDESPFYTEFNGASQRLPNGNTLITESGNGRGFEVTPAGKIVWEFYNPHRAGRRQELIATLFEIERLGPDFPTDWIARGSPSQN